MKICILGYGNLGRGIECAVKQNDDMGTNKVIKKVKRGEYEKLQ